MTVGAILDDGYRAASQNLLRTSSRVQAFALRDGLFAVLAGRHCVLQGG